MQVALFTTFAASRKEPLVEMIERIHAGFRAAGFGEPAVRFSLSDAPEIAPMRAVAAIAGIKRVSSIARVLKRWPQLEPFARVITSPAAGGATSRVMSNLLPSGTVEPVDFAVLREIARGVPKSFPFHGVALHFSAPGFSEGPALPPTPDPWTLSMLMRAGVDIGAGHPTSAGVSVQDAWWVNGRQRSLAALRIVDVDPAARSLPAPPADVASVFAACGKVRKTIQVPIVTAPAAPPGTDVPQSMLAKGEAIRSIVRAYRTRMGEFLDALPHDLPQREEVAPAASPTGLPVSGPKKPELVRAFEPMGYDCRGDSGTFTLKRRTGANLTVKLSLDVGTWSNSLTAFMQVLGLIDGEGFKATLSLPASRRAARGLVNGVELPAQFPIGGAERWKQIVDNLAALVAALDRTFVPEIETASGPSPEWFRPETT
jgi:hypothetical protein